MNTIRYIFLLVALATQVFAQAVGTPGKAVAAGLAPLVITTTSPLPSGTQGSAYTPFQMTAVGGQLPYTWSCPATCALLSAMNINSSGSISGTPGTAGAVSAGLRVCDSATPQNCTNGSFSITIQSSGTGCAAYAANRTITTGDPTQAPPGGSLLNVAGASYCMPNDITCPDTCFSVQAGNISLDGTSHTATYASVNSAQKPRYGFVGFKCSEAEASAAGNPCGGTFANPSISNITFTQGAGAIGLSDAIRLGDGTCGGATLTNVTTNITQPGGTTNPGTKASRSLYMRYCQGALNITNFTTHNSEVWVQNRTSIEGPDIRLENWTSNPGALTLVNSDISSAQGSGQGGVYPGESWNATVHDTVIGASGHVVQDFGAFVWGTNSNWFNITINCTSCRGVQVGGHNFHPPATDSAQFHDSTVITHMLPQYCPDNQSCPNTSIWGCENHGTYGIQFDDGPTNSTVYNNSVTVHALACAATALRITDIGTGNTTHNNSFVSIRDPGAATGLSFSYGTEAVDTGIFNSTDDTFQAASFNFFGDWLGQYAGAVFLRSTIVKGGNADPGYITFSFKNGDSSNCGVPSQCAIHWFFIDPTFSGGATKDSHNMISGSNGGGCAGCGPSEYFIQRTYKPTVICAGGSTNCTPGQPVSGATVTVNDSTATQVFTGTTDASGHIASGAGTVLTEFRRANCTTFSGNGKQCNAGLGTVFKEMHTPHTISISKAGCTTLTPTLDLTTITNGEATETRNLSCP